MIVTIFLPLFPDPYYTFRALARVRGVREEINSNRFYNLCVQASSGCRDAKGWSGAAEKLLDAVSTPPSVSSHCSFLSLKLHASPATMDRRSFQRPISGDLQQDSDAVGHHPAAPAPDRKPLRQGRRRCGFIKQTNGCFLVRRREDTSNLDTTAGHNRGCPESIRR